MAGKVRIATSRWLFHDSYTNGTVHMEHNENSKRDTFYRTEGVDKLVAIDFNVLYENA
jgi:hypothetical protein